MKRSSFRPLSIAEIAERASRGTQLFDLAVREFLDSWQTLSRDQRADALAEKPVPVGPVQDAYLAAVAEHWLRSTASMHPIGPRRQIVFSASRSSQAASNR